MQAITYSTVRNNLKSYCDRVCRDNEIVIVTRKNNENVVLVSLDEWNTREKKLKEIEYFAKIDASMKEVQEGRIVVRSLEDLEAMTGD